MDFTTDSRKNKVQIKFPNQIIRLWRMIQNHTLNKFSRTHQITNQFLFKISKNKIIANLHGK